MKKLIGFGLLLLAGCKSAPTTTTTTSPTPGPTTATPTTSPGTVGAASATDALAALLSAAKAEDLQAFGAVWGNENGSVREQWPRSEFEMRAFYSVKCLRHDKYTILSNAGAPSTGRLISVQLVRGPLTAATNFTVVPGPKGRWFVQKFDPEPLTKICQA